MVHERPLELVVVVYGGGAVILCVLPFAGAAKVADGVTGLRYIRAPRIPPDTRSTGTQPLSGSTAEDLG